LLLQPVSKFGRILIQATGSNQDRCCLLPPPVKATAAAPILGKSGLHELLRRCRQALQRFIPCESKASYPCTLAGSNGKQQFSNSL